MTGTTGPLPVLPVKLPGHNDFLMSAGGLDFNIHAGRQVQLVKGFDRLGRGLHNVDQPFVRADLELLPGFFVHVWTGLHRVSLDARRQGNWTVNHGVRPLGRVDYIHRTLIQDRMIVGFHANANYFICLTGHGHPPGNFKFPIAKITAASNAGNLKSYRFRKITSTA
jgi:hypothetical protein